MTMHSYSKNNSDKSSHSSARSFFSKGQTEGHESKPFFNLSSTPDSSLIQTKCKHHETESFRLDKKADDEVVPEEESIDEEQIQTKAESDTTGDRHTHEGDILTDHTHQNSAADHQLSTTSGSDTAQSQLQHITQQTANNDTSQSTHGNPGQAIQRMPDPEEDEKSNEDDQEQDTVQTKLTFGQPNDPYEQEANADEDIIFRQNKEGLDHQVNLKQDKTDSITVPDSQKIQRKSKTIHNHTQAGQHDSSNNSTISETAKATDVATPNTKIPCQASNGQTIASKQSSSGLSNQPHSATSPMEATHTVAIKIQAKCEACAVEQNLGKDNATEAVDPTKKIYAGGASPSSPQDDDHGEPIQAKLNIGQADDRFEHEADLMADWVVQRMAQDSGSELPVPAETQSTNNVIQRDEEERPLALLGFTPPFLDEIAPDLTEQTVQPAAAGQLQQPDTALTNEIMALRGGGAPMPVSDQQVFEKHFGADFSDIRFHTDSRASKTASALNARAYTLGRDVVFGANQFAPGTQAGKKLIAHELTHTLQQGAASKTNRIQRDGKEEGEQTRVIIEDVDKKLARKKNRALWRSGLSTIKPFHDQGAHPFQSPKKFYQLTVQTQEFFGKQLFEIGSTSEEKGVFSKNLIRVLEIFSISDDPEIAKIRQDIITGNHFLKGTLQRFRGLLTSRQTHNPPLTSRSFRYRLFFKYINLSENFALKEGKSGEDVTVLQNVLIGLKYLSPDITDIRGKFEEQTKQALMSFQRDMGFEGKDVDGVLGHRTLRQLDTRMNARGEIETFSTPQGEFAGILLTKSELGRPYGTSFEDRRELAILILEKGLKILRDDAIKLLPESEDKRWTEGTFWWQRKNAAGEEVYIPITQEMLDSGYVVLGLATDIIRQFQNRIVEVRGEKISAEEAEREAREKLYKLQGKRNLYVLRKEIKQLDKELTNALISSTNTKSGMPRHGSVERIARIRKKLEAKQAQLQAELDKLGITLEEFEASIQDFLSSFQTFSVLTALRMLNSNEKKTLVAEHQLESDSNITEIKDIIRQLVLLYDEADKHFWEGARIFMAEGTIPFTNNKEIDSAITLVISGTPILNTTAVTLGPLLRSIAIYRYQDDPKVILNDSFKKAQALEKQAHQILAEGANKFNILAYPDLDLKGKGGDYLKMNNSALSAKLNSFISASDDGVLANIDTMKKQLQESPSKVWELEPVWTQAVLALGITKKDPQYEIITGEVKRRKNAKTTRDILLAVGGIALGLLALASGPVGWAALAGSIVVGSIDAYIQYQEISFIRTARRTALDPKDALSNVDPSWVWFYISLAGVALDFLDVVKVIKIAKTAKEADKLIAKATDDLAEEIKRLRDLGSDEAAKQADKLEELKSLLTTKKTKKEFAENLNLILKLDGDPQAMVRLSESMAHNKQFGKALKGLGKLLGESSEHFNNAIRFYGGIGNDLTDELPELFRLIKRGSLKEQPDLMAELLTQPALQKVTLDHATDPNLLAREWKVWDRAGRVGSFVSYLKKAGYDTELTRGESLAKLLGEVFVTGNQLTKNRQVLHAIAPRLDPALESGKLPADLVANIKRHLAAEIIGETDDLARAQKRLVEVLGPLIGGDLKSNREFAELIRYIDDAEFIRKIFDSAANLPGKESYTRILAELVKAKSPTQEVLDELLKIGVVTDKNTLETLMANSDLRKALIANPQALRILKRCASPCFPSTLTADQVVKINNILSRKTLTGAEFRRLNEYIYLHRSLLETTTGFDDFLLHLGSRFDEIINGKINKIPAGELLLDPTELARVGARISTAEVRDIVKRLKALDPPKLAKVKSSVLSDIVRNGIPESLLEDIINTAITKGLDPDDMVALMTQVKTASGIAKRGEMRQLGKVLYALGDETSFENAQMFLDLMRNYKTPNAGMFDDILSRLELNDIAALTIPRNVSKPHFLQIYANFKPLLDASILNRRQLALLANKLTPPGAISIDDILEIKRVLTAPQFVSDTDLVKVITGKLIKEEQNLHQFINDVLKGKSVTSEIIPNIRARRPDVTLEEALQTILKDPGLSFFNGLSHEGTKRLAILANSEPNLAIMLEKMLYQTSELQTKLGPGVKKAVTIDAALQAQLISALESIPIGNPASITLGNIRGDIVKQINKVLGENLDISDIRKLTDDIVKTQGSRGSLFEHWVRANFVDPLGAIPSLAGKAPPFPGVKGAAKTAKKVQFDSHFIAGGGNVFVGFEMKHIDGVLSGEQLKRYSELVKNPGKYAANGTTFTAIDVRYVFSKKSIAQQNAALIESHLGSNAVIYYVDNAGKIKVL